MQSGRTLRLILGDQLNASHSWFTNVQDNCLYLIAELPQETGYVRHHVQKVCAFFAAMEQFARALQQAGHQVLYLTLDETADYPTLPDLLSALIEKHAIHLFEFQRPDEYRLLEQLRDFSAHLSVPVREWDSEHFLVPFEELPSEFKPDTAHRMEAFYRRLRKRSGILMDGKQPIGGQWNYDENNRNTLRDEDIEQIPSPVTFDNDVSAILDRLQRHKVDTFGTPATRLGWPTSRKQARALLEDFCHRLLPRFGQFQDAMTAQSPHGWSLYHSRLSFALNAKILSPRQVIDRAIQAWEADPTRISLPQIEGFVRQILGWREFVRGIYWANMPNYACLNSLGADAPLPRYFWSGDTRMNCMKHCLGQSLDVAYAHHIQRLMVIGNFCLLVGANPDKVDQWYLGVYVDALEWVELPNTRGMSQFGDGGLLASKPYAASGQYINRMSDYCTDCHYRIDRRTGERACPFNSLYWAFLDRHRERFIHNPRMRMIYSGWDKRAASERDAILEQADRYIANIEQL
ncbi:Protein related to deoxyribodipyrimidine photolyase [Marinobacterium lacunae]|uniref:Protein related to deoxyribodipyrimidine photolyase n=1 Tax=Marinobacterium lacunae TaxID=1232683 RepID=A0A081G3W8_9GAMM|nr:cryptochrome/photolyase family protein [Marinobacterium lacunae]KEA65473.1 Protein related to deoxyribodipyrimidine photolyase [Marinobacterium lacunae]